GLSFFVIQQAADDEALTIGKFDFGLDFAGGDGGYIKSRNLNRLVEVELTDFRRYLEADRSARRDGGNEVQANAKFLEFNTDCGSSAGTFRHREGKLAASKEACFFAVDGHYVGLGQRSGRALGFQGLNRCAEIESGEEGK